MTELINNALVFVKDFFKDDHSGHDYYHTLRVYKLAKSIAERENADIELTSIIAITRTNYIKEYLKEFFDEWDGIK